jgi:hypothetical protein
MLLASSRPPAVAQGDDRRRAQGRRLLEAKGKSGFNTFMRFFCAWVVLFGSKFVILEGLSFAFEKDVHFTGVFHGIVWLIIVVGHDGQSPRSWWSASIASWR